MVSRGSKVIQQTDEEVSLATHMAKEQEERLQKTINSYHYKYVKGRQLKNDVFRMHTVYLLAPKTFKQVGSFSWSRDPNEKEIGEMVTHLINDIEIPTIWNKYGGKRRKTPKK